MPGATPTADPTNEHQLRLFDDQRAVEVRRLRAISAVLVMNRQAKNTRDAYASDWKDFRNWCADRGRDPLPASQDTLQLYITDLIERRSFATVQRRIAAISAKHREHQHEPPYGYAAKELMRGIARTRGTAQKKKRPLAPEDLRKICSRLMQIKTLHAVRDRALLTLGFAGGMRRSEIAALDLADIAWHPKGVALTIRRSKTDQQGRGREVGIFRGRRATTCPVRSLKAWLYIRGREPGPLFPGTKGRITGVRIAQIVRAAVESIGLDPKHYGPHSLRAGCITAAVLDGMPESLVMQRSGHRSIQTIAGYVRPASLFAADILRRAM